MTDRDTILSRTCCLQITDFPGVDDSWLEERAKEIGHALLDRLAGKLEWGQVVALPSRKGIGLALLFFRDCEQRPELIQTIMGIVCEMTGIEIPKGKRGRLNRKGGLPRFGLGPRFSAEFYETKGRSAGVTPDIRLTL